MWIAAIYSRFEDTLKIYTEKNNEIEELKFLQESLKKYAIDTIGEEYRSEFNEWVETLTDVETLLQSCSNSDLVVNFKYEKV